MKIILLKDVSKVGKKYETKEVSSGYALNMLIPKGVAIAATPDAVKRIEAEKKRTEGERKVQEDLMVKNIVGLDKVSLTVKEKANEKGHLFAGLHKDEIAKIIKEKTELDIESESIMLDSPIKEVGEHVISVSGAGKNVKFTLVVEKA